MEFSLFQRLNKSPAKNNIPDEELPDKLKNRPPNEMAAERKTETKESIDEDPWLCLMRYFVVDGNSPISGIDYDLRGENIELNQEMILKLLKSPRDFVSLIGEDNVASVEKWVGKMSIRERARKERLQELRVKFPDSPLMKGKVENIPAHFVPVYHCMDYTSIPVIEKEGLKSKFSSSGDDSKKEASENFKRWQRLSEDFRGKKIAHEHYATYNISSGDLTQEIIESQAPEGITRNKAVFAYDCYQKNFAEKLMGHGGSVVLEIWVDPKKVPVCQVYNFEQVVFSSKSYDYAMLNAKKYWQDSMTLEDYLKIPEPERLKDSTELLLQPESVANLALMRVVKFEQSRPLR